MQKTKKVKVFKALAVSFLSSGFSLQASYQIKEFDPYNEQDLRGIYSVLDSNNLWDDKADAFETLLAVSSSYITIFILKIDTHAIGFITLMPQSLPFGPNFQFSCDSRIVMVAIDKKHQSQGYGTILMKHALQYLKDNNKQKVVIEMYKENLAAYSLCKKMNFNIELDGKNKDNPEIILPDNMLAMSCQLQK